MTMYTLSIHQYVTKCDKGGGGGGGQIPPFLCDVICRRPLKGLECKFVLVKEHIVQLC